MRAADLFPEYDQQGAQRRVEEKRATRLREIAKAAAGEAVLRAVAHDGMLQKGSLVNTSGYKDFPPEVLAHDRSVGPHVFFPADVLACFALDRPIPEPSS